jgi:hypothetical protein
VTEFATDLWKTHLPEGWEGGEAEDDDGVVLFHPDGPGELQITVSEKEEGLVDEADLEYFAADLLEDNLPETIVRVGPFQGLFFEYDEDGEYWREWFLAYDELFFYVTYSCDVANKHQEDHAITEILKSISFH